MCLLQEDEDSQNNSRAVQPETSVNHLTSVQVTEAPILPAVPSSPHKTELPAEHTGGDGQSGHVQDVPPPLPQNLPCAPSEDNCPNPTISNLVAPESHCVDPRGNICIMVTMVNLTQDMLMLLTMRTQVMVMPVGISGHIIVMHGTQTVNFWMTICVDLPHQTSVENTCIQPVAKVKLATSMHISMRLGQMGIAGAGVPLPMQCWDHLKEEAFQVSTCNALPEPRNKIAMDKLLEEEFIGTVLWEEKSLPKDAKSVMDTLILQTNFTPASLSKIYYFKSGP
ncbi:hypothetical protein BD769DRAFT_1669947 [Suillus cothurnatus]|nr:hypothetical protein BD769DRAFT_1669947 [Suillus cothurnatus]